MWLLLRDYGILDSIEA